MTSRAVGIFEDELGEERGAVGVVVALVLPSQPAQRPPFSHDRAEHIVADDKIVGHVVFRDHQAVPIRRPPGGEDLVADHGTVQVGFDNTERRDAEGRARWQVLEAELTPQVRGRFVLGSGGRGGSDESAGMTL